MDLDTPTSTRRAEGGAQTTLTEILATKPPNDDVEHDVATTEGKVGGAPPIEVVSLI